MGNRRWRGGGMPLHSEGNTLYDKKCLFMQKSGGRGAQVTWLLKAGVTIQKGWEPRPMIANLFAQMPKLQSARPSIRARCWRSRYSLSPPWAQGSRNLACAAWGSGVRPVTPWHRAHTLLLFFSRLSSHPSEATHGIREIRHCGSPPAPPPSSSEGAQSHSPGRASHALSLSCGRW